jgi:hypothetical protein
MDRDYCMYCKSTRKEVRKRVRKTGRRDICYARGTPKGFHRWRYVPPDKEN